MLGWFGHFGLLVPLALVGVIATWPDRRRLWIVHALALAYAASVVMFFVFARYRYPLVPFLMLFAADTLRLTCARVTSRARSLRVRVEDSWRLVLVAVAIFCEFAACCPRRS